MTQTEPCGRCVDGYIEVKVAEGSWYTRACENVRCGFQNGVLISTKPLEGTCGQCIKCGQNSSWKLVAE